MKSFALTLLIFLVPASVFAFEYRREPDGLFFTVFDEIRLILNSENLDEFHQEGVCEGKVVDHVAFRFSGGEGGPLWTPDVFDAKSTTTLTLGPGEYDAIALGGYSGESICYLTNMEVHSDNRLIVTKPKCSDGIDNDGDGMTDFEGDNIDAGCADKFDNDENGFPEITLNGDDEITLTIGSVFEDPGAVAADAEDDPDPVVVVAGDTVDINTAGDYEITYNAVDSDGIAAPEKIRTVHVRAQCSDGINNDADNFTDTDDMGCHTDTDPLNSNTYDPNDNDEFNPPPSNGGVGGGGGGGGGGAVLGAFIGPAETFSIYPSAVSAGYPDASSSTVAEPKVLGAKISAEDQVAMLRTRITALQEKLKVVMLGYVKELLEKIITLLEAKVDKLSSL